MKQNPTGYQFGTFAGVFTPSILTIFGVVMFMIIGGVVAARGIAGALVLLAVAESIALTTGLSISSISTNTPVKGGGPYFLISRTLGPGFGWAVGVAFYFSQAVSVPFYVLGFVKAMCLTFPALQPYALWIGLIPLLVMFIISMISANLAIKTQFVILTVLGLAIVFFLGGAAFNGPATVEGFRSNWAGIEDDTQGFAYYLAIFFPAVSGFLSGVSMSGDLKDPAKALPRGTIAAILTGLVVYAIEIMLMGAAFDRQEMLTDCYSVLANHALFGWHWLVFAGVIAATLSSALGALLGGPRILQAIAVDGLSPLLKPFAWSRGKNNDPYVALLLSFLLAAGIIWWGTLPSDAAQNSPTNPLNIAATLVSMFLLLTYALINLAAFVESFGANPSFRPQFRHYHWILGLYGTLAATACAFCINPLMATIATLAMTLLFLAARRYQMRATFGDARRGFIFSSIRKYLLLLEKLPDSRKNWRPRITVLVGDVHRQIALLRYAELLANSRGINSMLTILTGVTDDAATHRRTQLAALRRELKDEKLEFFPAVVTTPEPSFDHALRISLQSYSIGPLAPNIILTGWPRAERKEAFLSHIMSIRRLGFNAVIMLNLAAGNKLFKELMERRSSRPESTIDIWWRGRGNGSLMLILAYLLTCNDGWRGVSIRLLRLAPDAERQAAYEDMTALVDAARISAECRVVSDSRDFRIAFRELSADAAAIFLGFNTVKPVDYAAFYQRNSELMAGMPATFLVCSNGDADIEE